MTPTARWTKTLVLAAFFSAIPYMEATAAPIIAGLNPSTGPTSGGLRLTISGAAFSPTGNSVTVDGLTCPIVVESASEIQCMVPEGTGVANDVVVSDDAGTPSNAQSFAYDGPVIDSISPTDGRASGGTVLTLTGSNFGAASADAVRSVSIGATGEACALVPGAGAHTEVQCTTPPGTGTDVGVSITVDGQTSNSALYDYNPPPSISSLSLTSGATAGGEPLTINGLHFKKGSGGSGVVIDNKACPVTLDSETEIVCTTPAGAGADREVIVSTDGQSSEPYFWDYSPPAVVSVTPNHGSTQGNIPITIVGSNFGDDSPLKTVTVGTSACPIDETGANDHETLVCTLPEGQGAGRTVEVVVAGQASNPDGSVNYDAPDISSVTPTRGSAAGGFPITISGSNFGVTASVDVDGNSCPLTMQSHTELRCTAPAAAAGLSLPVLVSVSGQVDASSIEYVEPACGNGIRDIQVGEVCDDNNSDSGDGCSADCRTEVDQTDDQVACIVALNKAGAKVFAARGKDALTCAKKNVAAPCVATVTSGGFTAAVEKVQATSDKKCPTAPDFGSSSVSIIQDQNHEEADSLLVDMFGADPDAALAPDASAPNRGACQDAVIKADLKYASARYKAFNKCKKAGFKDGDGKILTDSALAACLETADDDPAAAKAEAKQFESMIDSCLNVSEDRALAFPGRCAAASDTAACLGAAVRCRVCRAIAASDSLETLDCDDDDDGLDNDSCDD
jgi:cysteine-rich repeat protein